MPPNTLGTECGGAGQFVPNSSAFCGQDKAGGRTTTGRQLMCDSESKLRLADVFQQSANAPPGCALRGVGGWLGGSVASGNIQVRPRQSFAEMLDEECSGDCAAGAPAGVFDVTDIALDLIV